MLQELAQLNATHDVFLVLIDSAFAFELPTVSAGWIEAFDVETGRARVMSRGALSAMSPRRAALAGRGRADGEGRRTSTSLRIGVDEQQTDDRAERVRCRTAAAESSVAVSPRD